ncbi:MAG: DUF5522 domain-containing protein [Bacteroidia bacterium]
MTDSKQNPDKKRVLKPLPLEPGDYYFNENGFMVFTEKYHLKRGFCCGSKCKHCPFNWENVVK